MKNQELYNERVILLAKAIAKQEWDKYLDEVGKQIVFHQLPSFADWLDTTNSKEEG